MSFDRDVTIGFNADIAGYGSSISQLIAQTNQYSSAADGMIGKVAKVNDVVMRGVQQLSALSKTNKVATDSAAAYQQRLSKIETSATVTNKSFGQLEKTTMSLARSFPIGIGKAVEQVEALQETGVTTNKEIAKLGAGFTKLGAATGSFAPELGASMLQVGRTFGTTNDQVLKFGDSLTTITHLFGANAGAVTSFAKSIAPISATVGMSETSVLGLSTAFSRLGEDGFGAANAFNKVMLDMNRSIREGTPEAKAYAEVMGTTTDALKRTWETNPSEGFISFVEAIKKQGPDSIRTLEMLGFEGIRTQKSLTALASSGNVREIVAKAQSAYGNDSTSKAAETAFGGVNDQMTRMSETMSQTVSAAGRPFLGFLEKVLAVANSLSESLNSVASSDFMKIATKIVGVSGAAFVLGKTAASWAGGIATAQNIGRGVIGSAAAQDFTLGRREPWMAAPDSPLAMRAGAAYTNFFGLSGGDPAWKGPARGARSGLRTAANLYSTLVELNTNEIRAARGLPRVTTESGDRIREALETMRSVATDRTISPEARRQTVREQGRIIRQATGDQLFRGDGLAGAARASGAALWNTAAYAGSGLRSLGGMAAGFLGGPVGVTMAGGAAAAAAYGQWSKGVAAENEAKDIGRTDAYRAFNDFAEKAGIASKGLVSFTQALAESTGKIAAKATTLSDAYRMTQEEIVNASSPAYERAMTLRQNSGLKEAFWGARDDPRKLALEASSKLGPNASPEAINRVQQDMINQFGVNMASEIMKQLQSIQAMPSTEREQLYLNQASLSNRGTFRTKEGNEYTQAAVSEATIRQNRQAMVYGAENAQLSNLADAQKAFDKYVSEREGVVSVAGGRSLRRGGLSGVGGNLGKNTAQSIAATLGLSNEETNKLVSAINKTGSSNDLGQLLEDAGITGLALTYQQQQAKGVNFSTVNSNRFRQSGVSQTELDWQSTVSGMKAVGAEAGNVGKDIAGLSKVIRESATPVFDEWASAGMKGANELQKAYAEVQKAPGDINKQRKLAEIASEQALKDSGNNISLAKQMIAAAMTSATGTEQPSLKYAIGLIDQRSGLINAGKGDWQQQSEAIAAGLRAKADMDRNGANWSEEKRAEEQKFIDTGIAAQEQRQGQMRSWIRQYENLQISMRRMDQDYQSAVFKSNRDFNRQLQWTKDDFYTQQKWAAQDFYRQMQYSEDDYHKSRARANRDFNKQIRRMSEEQARTAYDPYARIQPKMVTDASVLRGSLETQNQALSDQLSGVKKLAKQGLSKDAIDQLRLMDPSQAAQVQRLLSDMANDPNAIPKLNKLIQERLKLGAGMARSEYNKSFQNMKEDFKTSMSDMATDFATSVQRSEDAYSLSMRRSQQQFDKAQSRTKIQHATAMSDMARDHMKAQTRAQEDLSKLASYFTKEYKDIVKEFLTDLANLPGITNKSVMKAIQKVFEEDAKVIDQTMKNAAEAAKKAKEEADIEAHRRGTAGQPGTGGVYEMEGATSAKGSWTSIIFGKSGVPASRNPFGKPNGRYALGGHTGIDWGKPAGTPIYSPVDGSVTNAGPLRGSPALGINVTTTAPGGKYLGYNHLSSVGVARGQGIKKGDFLGRVGSTGTSTGAHLHLELKEGPGWEGKWSFFSDPVRYLNGLAKGGIVKQAGTYLVGEAGHEAVVPLNRDGARVLADAMVRYLNNSDVQRARVGAYSTPMVNNVYTYDQRNQFTGNITVQSQDPNDMARKLSAKQRSDRLARKVGTPS